MYDTITTENKTTEVNDSKKNIQNISKRYLTKGKVSCIILYDKGCEGKSTRHGARREGSGWCELPA